MSELRRPKIAKPAGTICSVPGCGKESFDWHHTTPFSQGGTEVIALCHEHHVQYHSSRGDFAKWGANGGAIAAALGNWRQQPRQGGKFAK